MRSEFRTPADIIPRLVLLAAGETDSAKMLLIGEQLHDLLRTVADSGFMADPAKYDIGQFLRQHADGPATAEVFIKAVMSIVYAEALEDRKRAVLESEEEVTDE
jgi:hypothetical protein